MSSTICLVGREAVLSVSLIYRQPADKVPREVRLSTVAMLGVAVSKTKIVAKKKEELSVNLEGCQVFGCYMCKYHLVSANDVRPGQNSPRVIGIKTHRD